MKKDVQQYLQALLTEPVSYILTEEEVKKTTHDKVGYIFDKLMRKKFRRRVSEETRSTIAEKIKRSVAENRPIHFTIPFGGYKHYWNNSYPEPDWAEAFHLTWMYEYIAPILAAHEPGVILEYISEDLILPRMNNYPDEAIDSYAQHFRKLIAWYQQSVPKNLEIRFWRVSEKYDKTAIINQVEALLPERKSAFNLLTPEEQSQETHRSSRSVFWSGKQDLSNLSEEAKHIRIIESRLIELAFYDTEGEPEYVGGYYNEDNHICLCFSFGLSHDNDAYGDLTIQSASGSSVDYWIGRGVLVKDEPGLRGTIFSQQQYKGITDGELEIVSVELPGLSSKNYQSIEVIHSNSLRLLS